MKLTVVIVSYNVCDYLQQCLISLRRALKNVDAQVVVVDNHSKDDTVERLRKKFHEVQFISSNHNLGFSKANNLAIKQSNGQYVLLLNPDTIVGESVIDQCLTFMDSHPKAGGLGVQMLKADGSKANESRRGLPTPMTAFYKMSGLCSRFPKSRRFGKYYMGYLSWDEAAEIEVVSGAFFMLRREALDKVGLLDEDYFMYGEDIDLSYRLLKGGWQNWYLPAKILHYKGESTVKSSFRYVHVFYEAMLIFFKKHYSHLSFLLGIPIKMAIYAKASMAFFSTLWHRLKKSLGFIDRKTPTCRYVFICRQEHMDACKTFVRQKAIDAVFVEGDNVSLPEGHLSQKVKDVLNASSCQYIVYDISSYSFDNILELFSRNPQDNLFLATYDPENNIVITAEDVLK